jgi:transposase-like protein
MDAVSSSLYKGHRYPVEVISHCVWLYHRFPLSFHEVEEMMLARGVLVTYETIRGWSRSSGIPTRMNRAADGLRRSISSISTRCSSRSRTVGLNPSIIGPFFDWHNRC